MLEKKQVEGAVDAILSILKAKDDSVSLVDQPKKIDLQFTLKHVPGQKHKTIPIDLPASLHYELREVCIFVKDLNKKTREYEATVQHYKDLFSKHKITAISKIIPIKALHTDYCLPSSKISLAKAYDLYLADGCVMGLMPGILGKVFYAKKRTIPVKVNLGVKDLKKEIDRAVNNTRCVLQGSGSSSLVTVAHDRLDKKEIVGNVLAACKRIAEQIPGGESNIRNMYIKSSDTTAVPLYIDIGSANKIKLPEVKPDKIITYIDDITTVKNGQVMISADGHVKVIKDKKGKKDSKGSVKDEEETEIKIKEEEIDDGSQTAAEKVDVNSEPEIIDSDNDDKEDSQAEMNKAKKSGKMGKRQKKNKSKVADENGQVKRVQKSALNDVEMIGSDNGNKEDVQAERSLRSNSGKVGKRQKRWSDGNNENDEDIPVEKKKVKQTEIVGVKQDQKLNRKDPKKFSKKGGKKAKSG